MAVTTRHTLTTTPQRMDVTPDDNIAFRALTAIAQAAGTVVVCEDADTDPTTEGARLPVVAGQTLEWPQLAGRDSVWLAVASGTLDVDVVETGVQA